MTSPASRHMRSARNELAEALGLGEAFPLADLPVVAEPPVAPFGAIAKIRIEDSERTVVYRLLNQDGQPLPGGAKPEGTGMGSELAIDTPAISEDITFTVQAERLNGRRAMLTGTGQVRVGLDDSLAVTAWPVGPTPTVIDHGATVQAEVAKTQEGVVYRLVGRPSSGGGDAMDDDIALSDPAGVAGTGGNIRLTSVPLLDDVQIHVRAAKYFGGPNPKPPQATLLKATLPVFVRPGAELAVTAKPEIVDHGGKAAVKVASSATGVAYTLFGKAVADSEFDRLGPADPSLLIVAVPDGEVRLVTPPATAAWEAPPGFKPMGDPAAGTGDALSLPVEGLIADTMFVVEARKEHAAEPGFTTAERLTQPVAILVRPDPKPKLRLAAQIVDGKLVELIALGGQAGVFYSLAAPDPIGELYMHQHSPNEQASNKGVGAMAVTVDLVIAAGLPIVPTSTAPPPVPRLDVDQLALPVALTIKARRAMTGLTADVGTAKVAKLPKVEVQPASVAIGASATIVIEKPGSGESYAVKVDGKPIADPIAGAGAPLSLDTGPLAAGNRVELWISATEPGDAIQVERFTPLVVTIG